MNDKDKLINVLTEIGLHFICIATELGSTIVIKGTIDECEVDFDLNNKLIIND